MLTGKIVGRGILLTEKKKAQQQTLGWLTLEVPSFPNFKWGLSQLRERAGQ